MQRQGQIAEFLRAAERRAEGRDQGMPLAPAAPPETRPSEASVCSLTLKRPSASNDRSRVTSSRPSKTPLP